MLSMLRMLRRFMCLFNQLPSESMLRVWDLLLFEGSKTLFRTSLALLVLQRLLTYAHVCSRMLTYAQVVNTKNISDLAICCRMLTYGDVC